MKEIKVKILINSINFKDFININEQTSECEKIGSASKQLVE